MRRPSRSNIGSSVPTSARSKAASSNFFDAASIAADPAVTAARIAASEGRGGLRAGGPPADRLAGWLDGMETACLTATRHLDDIEEWSMRAETEMAPLSGRTPPALCAVLTEWPLVSAPMAEALTGASRAAVQRNLAWMEAHGLVFEMTGHGRYRMWRATNGRP